MGSTGVCFVDSGEGSPLVELLGVESGIEVGPSFGFSGGSVEKNLEGS